MQRISKQGAAEDKLLCGGMLIASFFALVQLLQFTRLDVALWVALYAFAVALPLLTGAIAMFESGSRGGEVIDSWRLGLSALGGGVAGLTGLAALFWHFSWIAGTVFSVTCVLSIVLWYGYSELTAREGPGDKETSPKK
jgi:hypothetical protein